MQVNSCRVTGGFCVVAALAGYLWWMATRVVPDTLELAALLGMSVPAPVAWIALTALAVLIALGADRVARKVIGK